VFLTVAFAVGPWLFLRFDRVVLAVLVEARPVHFGADGLGFAGNLAFYADQFTARAGWFLTALIVPGYVLLARRHGRVSLPLFGAGLYLVFLCAIGLHWERWELPVSFLALQAVAAGIVWGWELTVQQQAWRLAFGVLISAAYVSLVLQAFYQTVVFRLPDTRYVALHFCETHGINSRNSAYENYTPFATTLHRPDYLPRRAHFQRIGVGPEQLLRAGRRYAILSSYDYDRCFAQPKRYERAIAAYATIRSKPLIARFESEAIVGLNSYNLSPFTPAAIVQLVTDLVHANRRAAHSGPVIEIRDLRAEQPKHTSSPTAKSTPGVRAEDGASN
jgi:hypothetical protein